MKRLRLILGIVSLAIVAGIVIVLIVTYNKRNETSDIPEITGSDLVGEEIESGDVPASLEARTITYTESKDGKTLWEIKADEARFYKDEDRSEFDNINVVFFYQDTYELTLSGDRGVLDNESKNISLNDNVTITAWEDYVLTTDTLHFDSTDNEISTDDPIALSGTDISFHGTGLTFDLEEEELFVHEDVVTDLNVKGSSLDSPSKKPHADEDLFGFDDVSSFSGGIVHITSRGLYGSRDGSFIRYTGGVSASHKDAVLTAGTITVYFAGDIGGMGDIKKITADGNVRFVRSDIRGNAGHLVFDYENEKLTLTGSPTLWRGDDMVTGETLTYDLNTKVSTATGTGDGRAHVTIYPKEEDF
ncbi:MAG: LPS export ABC transporter periplasmic protein LptC [Deltaproteobacteria bacterium]|nr:LPS export ABC transporter periplasmic protein LptC [Candidatus Zymogenaceae bacterium]